ncbi:MAG TPA: 3-isopropylmalate dehydratase [Firmicutes bacterium]|nr:3-isopropylmalate dehydratase [Candidatus Fermentithermobacillaceae bacterium]
MLRGKVLAKFGNDISTDDMASSKYVTSATPEALGKICMRDVDPDFPKKMAEGGFIVAGTNFGCGSSREWAPVALKAAGTKAVIAEEIARIFYRNALNLGLPVIEIPGITKNANVGDELEIDLESGSVKNLTTGVALKGIPTPEFLTKIMEAGGLVEFLKIDLAKSRGK